jgi:hypothetical protein
MAEGPAEKKKEEKMGQRRRRRFTLHKQAKAAALRIHLNLDGAPITSQSHTHPSHS